jgi:hypothetical protein
MGLFFFYTKEKKTFLAITTHSPSDFVGEELFGQKTLLSLYVNGVMAGVVFWQCASGELVFPSMQITCAIS